MKHCRRNVVQKYPFKDVTGSVESTIYTEKQYVKQRGTTSNFHVDILDDGYHHRKNASNIAPPKRKEQSKKHTGFENMLRKDFSADPDRPLFKVSRIPFNPNGDEVAKPRASKPHHLKIRQAVEEPLMDLVHRLCLDPFIQSLAAENETTDVYREIPSHPTSVNQGDAYSNVWGSPDEGCVTPSSSLCDEEEDQQRKDLVNFLQKLEEFDSEEEDSTNNLPCF